MSGEHEHPEYASEAAVAAALGEVTDALVVLAGRVAALEPPPPPPPPPPPIDPPPPPLPSDRQPVMLWVGEKNFGRFFDGTSFVTLAQLGAVAEQVVIQMGRVLSNPAIPTAANIDTWRAAIDAGFEVYPGHYVVIGDAAPQPFKPLTDDAGWTLVGDRLSAFAAKANDAGCHGLAIDLENYDQALSTFWRAKTIDVAFERAVMRTRAFALAPIFAAAGPLMVYTSSSASWPGSYYDMVQINAGRPDVYKTNLMPDFIDGLIDGGVQVVISDAVFHWGAQMPTSWFATQGYDMTQLSRWEAGATESARRVGVRWPTAKGSVMLWPDNQEKTPKWFAPAEMAEAFEAATRVCTGPVVMYQHTITTQDGLLGAPWLPMLEAIAGAVS